MAGASSSSGEWRCSSVRTLVRIRTAVSPKRSSVSGSTSPPSSERSLSTSASTSRSSTGAGRHAGLRVQRGVHHLAQLGRQVGRGSRRSGGSGLPTRRAVAAGLAARAGLLPVHAS